MTTTYLIAGQILCAEWSTTTHFRISRLIQNSSPTHLKLTGKLSGNMHTKKTFNLFQSLHIYNFSICISPDLPQIYASVVIFYLTELITDWIDCLKKILR